jgi:hypothetical protein
VNDALASLWKRADLRDHVFSADEVRAWSTVLRTALQRARILQRVGDAEAMVCDDCGESHSVEVIRDSRQKADPYYRCPRIGRVSLQPEDLRRWVIAFDRLAAFINKSLALLGPVIDVVAGRVWLLGRVAPPPDATEVFLFRGIWWPDATEVLTRCLRLGQSPHTVVLLPRRFPSVQIWENRQAALLALAEITDVDQSGLLISHDLILAASTRSNPPPHTVLDSPISSQALVALKVSRSIGSDAAVQALLALKDRKGWTMEELAGQVGTTARTVQSLIKRRTVRSSVFRTMADRLGISPEDLLAGNVPADK